MCGWHSFLSLLPVGYKSAAGRGQGEAMTRAGVTPSQRSTSATPANAYGGLFCVEVTLLKQTERRKE